jgi:hypothetical protein
MNNRPRIAVTRTATAVLLAAALLLLASPSVALAGQGGNGNPGNPGVLPPNADAYGQTYGEWNASWWQWAASLGFDLDAPCDTNQFWKAWFLAGNFGGTSVRECTVPAGTPLFFPVINVAYLPDPGETEDDSRQAVNDYLDGVIALSCTVGGVPLQNLWAYRAVAPGYFGLTFPDGWVLEPVLAGGYSVLLAPLPPGTYEIRFIAAHANGFALDVTYVLTVDCCPE